MKFLSLFLVMSLLSPLSPALAFELEGFFGVNSTDYKDPEASDISGVAALMKLNFYGSENQGWLLNINARGTHLMTSDFNFGYGWRTSGNWFFEGGGGLGYNAIFGSGPFLLGGTGYKLDSDFFVNFPIVITSAGQLFWTPYIGYVF